MSDGTESLIEARRNFDVSVEIVVNVSVHNPDVIERVTGAGGDEWRSRFYRLFDAHDVVEHLASNYVRNGVEDISRLDGWGDCSPDDVSFDVTDTLTMAIENV